MPRSRGSLVVGEIPNYPREWFPSVDGVMHFSLRKLMIALANRELDAPSFQRMVARMIGDADYEHILKSWLYLDNHDTFRLATTVPDAKARKLAQVLQFTLPGAVNLYYGTEVAMEGGDDPEMRGPMRWDRVAAEPSGPGVDEAADRAAQGQPRAARRRLPHRRGQRQRHRLRALHRQAPATRCWC